MQRDAEALAGEVVADDLEDVGLVLDADGLNAFGAEWISELDGRSRPLVLTPHPGEMARLTGQTVAELRNDPVGILQRASRRAGNCREHDLFWLNSIC